MKRLLVTRVIVPVISEVLFDSCVLIDDNAILAIGDYKELKGKASHIEDYTDYIIMPGFINAHSHLELSFKDKEIKATSFTDWIINVNAIKRSLSLEDFKEAILYGISEFAGSGVVAVGDISSPPHYLSYSLIKDSNIKARVYLEYLSPSPFLFEEKLLKLDKCAKELSLDYIGISPHSTYTLCKRAFRAVTEYISKNNYPAAIHVGESALEERFFANREGSLFDLINNFSKVDKDIKNTSPLTYIYSRGYLPNNSLLIHLNILKNAEIPILREKGCSVVHCPRSHSYFRNPPFKLKELLRAGINIAIGTDSLLSNTSLSFFEELRHMKLKFPFLSSEDIIRMATLNGSRALFLKDGFGKMEVNKPYSLIGLYCPHNLTQKEDILDYIIDYKSSVHNIKSL